MPRVYDKDKASARNKPDWLKIKLRGTADYADVARIVKEHGLHTICSSGMCPNKAECWSRRTATFMILGDVCTRSCRFCATRSGRAMPPDDGEPEKVAESVSLMGLRYVVITSVTRDDLPDGGAAHWAATVRAIKARNPHTSIELLIPDFDARGELIDTVLAAGADVVGHNIETVRRLTPQVRSRARYDTSLEVLRHISAAGVTAKSGLMVGLGESKDEVLETLADLHAAGCRIVTVGQYLQPTAAHWPVSEYVSPEKFEYYRREAERIGFDLVASAPLVRSSYMAERAVELLNAGKAEMG